MSKHITLDNLNAALPPLKHLIDKKAEGLDWNENDPAASGYIKNRPFYESVKETTVEIAQETTVTIGEEGTQINFTEPLIEGQTYTVMWNGTSYECIGRNYDGYIMIGNHAIYEYDNGIETDTGEPFAIETESGNCGALIYAESGITVTLSISYKSIIEKIKKIDEKYLPEVETIGAKGTGENAEVFNGNPSVSASGSYSHSEGIHQIQDDGSIYGAWGQASHAEGNETNASGKYSHAEGSYTKARGQSSHSEGEHTIANEKCAHAEGYNTNANGHYSHTEGYQTNAYGSNSHAEGLSTQAGVDPNNGDSSHAEGVSTKALGRASHAEGYGSTASGIYSHAEGRDTTASSEATHAEGAGTVASATYAHAEGFNTTASAGSAHAEGNETEASGTSSHAEGLYSKATHSYAHAEGRSTTASAEAAHSEGCGSIASGKYSHAEGYNTISSKFYQHAQGKYNIEDTDVSGKYAHIVGNGTGENFRSNAHTLDWNGLGWFAGGLKVGGTGQDDEAAKEVALKSDIADAKCVEVGEDQPTNTGVEVWIDTTDGSETIDIPEINDTEISLIDTWSSKKINDNDIYTGATAPSVVFENKVWIDTSASPAVIKRYNGTEWEDISSGGNTLMYTEIEDLTGII